MRLLVYKTSFKKEVALMKKRGLDLKKLENIVSLLQKDTPLPPKHRDHPLSGNWGNFRECHIQPDWLLIYQKQDSEDGRRVLLLEATGTHADLF